MFMIYGNGDLQTQYVISASRGLSMKIKTKDVISVGSWEMPSAVFNTIADEKLSKWLQQKCWQTR